MSKKKPVLLPGDDEETKKINEAIKLYQYGEWDETRLIWNLRPYNPVSWLLNRVYKVLDPDNKLPRLLDGNTYRIMCHAVCGNIIDIKGNLKCPCGHQLSYTEYFDSYTVIDYAKALLPTGKLNWIEQTIFSKIDYAEFSTIGFRALELSKTHVATKTQVVNYDTSYKFISRKRTQDDQFCFNANIELTNYDFTSYKKDAVDPYLFELLGSYDNYTRFMRIIYSMTFANIKQIKLFIKASSHNILIIKAILMKLYGDFIIGVSNQSKFPPKLRLIECNNGSKIKLSKITDTVIRKYQGKSWTIDAIIIGQNITSLYNSVMNTKNYHLNKQNTYFISIQDTNYPQEIPRSTLTKIVLDTITHKYKQAIHKK